jgi:cell division protein FtsQ
MARQVKRGATRKPVRKEKKVIAWHYIARQGLVILALLTAVTGILYARQSHILPILHVSVEGEFSHVDKEVLVKAVKPHTRGSFLSIDVDKVSDAGEELAWIKQVRVQRVWPDSLHLVVEEQIPVARWRKAAYVNDEGQLFPESKKPFPAALAILTGPEDSQVLMTKRYLDMNKALKHHGLEIKELVMDRRRAWSMALDNGVKVVLGRAESQQRFERFLRVYRDDLQRYQSQIVEMDMRYPNGLSVIWKTGQTPDFNGIV